MIDAVSQVLEEKREELMSSYLEQIDQDVQLDGMRKAGRAEIKDLASGILYHLGEYIDGADMPAQACSDFVSDTCFQLSIPLLETAYALYLLRDHIARQAAAEGLPAESVTRANDFFDRLVLDLLRRY